jgi:hypothetical protein
LNLWPVCLELCDFEEFSTAHNEVKAAITKWMTLCC